MISDEKPDRTLIFDFLPIDQAPCARFKRESICTPCLARFLRSQPQADFEGRRWRLSFAIRRRALDSNLKTLDTAGTLERPQLDFGRSLTCCSSQARPPRSPRYRRPAKHLQVKGEPITEAVAVTGQGVFETPPGSGQVWSPPS